jgi:hypothetical protein
MPPQRRAGKQPAEFVPFHRVVKRVPAGLHQRAEALFEADAVGQAVADEEDSQALPRLRPGASTIFDCGLGRGSLGSHNSHHK